MLLSTPQSSLKKSPLISHFTLLSTYHVCIPPVPPIILLHVWTSYTSYAPPRHPCSSSLSHPITHRISFRLSRSPFHSRCHPCTQNMYYMRNIHHERTSTFLYAQIITVPEKTTHTIKTVCIMLLLLTLHHAFIRHVIFIRSPKGTQKVLPPPLT